MTHLPLFVDIAGRPCLVVGAGEVAARKARLLLRSGADVTVVGAAAGSEVRRMQSSGELRFIKQRFRRAMLAGNCLVIAASDDEALNREVAEASRVQNIFCNVVDNRELSGCLLPAIVDRDPVTIAIGTGGDAPVLAQTLKSQLEAWLPARIGQLARRAGQWRNLVQKRHARLDDRRRFWQRFFDGPIAADLLAGRDAAAEAAMRRELIESPDGPPPGEAFIVGAGPGDPGLVTLRARQILCRADTVLYDSLVSAEVLDMARKDAERIDVGKRAGRQCMAQEDINMLLVDRVRAGQRVCRLKGGDPLVFGRGGEEAAALAAAGQRFEIVPGVSAALGCAAYAGIPLTLRGVSSSVTLATATLRNGDEADWRVLARSGQTLALYMALRRLPEIASRLMQSGLAADTPAAVVAAGTTNRQRVVRADLASIAARVLRAGIEAPAMLFVGHSVAAAAELAWFDGADAIGESAEQLEQRAQQA